MSLFTIAEGEPVCVGDHTIGNDDVGSAVQVEWNILDNPAACVPVFADDTKAETTITFPCVGSYTIQRCLFYQTQEQAPPDPATSFDGLRLNCPISMVEGESAEITLTGCENGTVTWSPGAGLALVGATELGATAVATQAGSFSIYVQCREYDVDGNETLTDTLCPITVYPAGTAYTCRKAEPYVATVVSCGVSCVCQEVDIYVSDCETTCIELQYGITFKACKACEADERSDTITRLSMTSEGGRIPYTCDPDDLIFVGCDEDEICCKVHQPAIIWNNASDCGWSFQATNAIEGSDVSGLLPCNPGQQFCFRGSTVITATGPAQLIDTLLIHGHNLESGIIETSPLEQFGGGGKIFGLVADDYCGAGQSLPIIVYFDEANEELSTVQITVMPDDPDKIYCIDNLFLGSKLALPDNSIPQPWTNPHTGMQNQVTLKESDCGDVIGIQIKRKTVNMQVPIKCITERWAYEKLRPLMRYLDNGNPFIFAWSINNFPQDIFYGYMTDASEGTTYTGIYQEVTLTANGWIRQRQQGSYV